MHSNQQQLTPRQKYYPWVVMAACCLYMAGTIGVGTNCTGIFLRPVADSLGVGIGTVSYYSIILSVVNAGMAPWVGRLIGRVDIRRLMTLGTLFIGGGHLLMSAASNLLFIYAGGALVGAGISMGTFMAVTVILNNWFFKNNGLVMGITLSTSSLVGIVANPAVNRVIELWGWRTAYLGMGVLILCAIPVIWCFIRMYPDQKGAVAWGSGTVPEEKPAAAPDPAQPAGDGVSLRSPALWAVLAFVFVLPFANNHVSYFQNVALSCGFSAALGASMISASLAGEFAGKLGIGWLSDRVGIHAALGIVMVMGGAGLAGLFFLGNMPAWFALLCALLYGPMQAVGTVGYPQMIREIFGSRHYPRVYPYMSIASTVSSSLVYPCYGFVYDATGSFVPTYAAALAGLGAALALLAFCSRMARRHRQA